MERLVNGNFLDMDIVAPFENVILVVLLTEVENAVRAWILEVDLRLSGLDPVPRKKLVGGGGRFWVEKKVVLKVQKTLATRPLSVTLVGYSRTMPDGSLWILQGACFRQGNL